MPTSEWHWQEGNKYAHEGLKTITFLNGGAAVAIITFGNYHELDGGMYNALLFFGLGAATAAIAFVLAYYTQLCYGNAELSETERARHWSHGQKLNIAAGSAAILSVLLFCAGLGAGAFSAPNSKKSVRGAVSSSEWTAPRYAACSQTAFQWCADRRHPNA